MKKIEKTFSSFSNSLLDFFINLEKNNNKEWFHENKKIYEKDVKEPVKLFLEHISALFAENNLPYIADPKVSLFRINRDIRFSANKEPYKTNLGILFPHLHNNTGKRAIESAGLYFHIDTKEAFIAGGIHMPEADKLRSLREKVADEWEELEKILSNKEFVKEFPDGLMGEKLARIPRGFPKDHPKEEWLRFKEYTVYSRLSYDIVFSDKFVDVLLKKGKVMAPFLEFLNDAL